MMRKVLSVAMLAGALCLLGMTRDAGATITIALEWSACANGVNGGCTATGTNSITVNPGGGQTLRLDVWLSHDITLGGPNPPDLGLLAHTFSLMFDTGLANELNFGPMASVNWAGSDVTPASPGVDYAPGTALILTESTGAAAGTVFGVDSLGLGANLPPNGAVYSVGSSTFTAPARYRVAQVFFTANASLNGDVISSGLFNGLFDQFLTVGGAVVPTGTITFGSASINVVPEPGTVSLLGLGLVGLVLAGRRSRRS